MDLDRDPVEPHDGWRGGDRGVAGQFIDLDAIERKSAHIDRAARHVDPQHLSPIEIDHSPIIETVAQLQGLQAGDLGGTQVEVVLVVVGDHIRRIAIRMR